MLALLRNPQYAVYGSLKQRSCGDVSELEQRFNAASINERANFEVCRWLAAALRPSLPRVACLQTFQRSRARSLRVDTHSVFGPPASCRRRR